MRDGDVGQVTIGIRQRAGRRDWQRCAGDRASGRDVDELTGYWNKLSEGAAIFVPLEKAPWGDSFGQLRDRFGVSWMVNIGGSPEEPTQQS